MQKKQTYDTAKKQEKAILVALITEQQNEEKTKIYLEELAFLALTLEMQVQKKFTQRLSKPETHTYLGKGKLAEVVEYAHFHEIDVIIFDDDLSPSQVRNLEKAFNGSEIDNAKIKIIDRSLLILDIFSMRAKTTQARTQVELAQYQYLYPRLTRMWTHLSKQKGGIGMRGPGEKELETDRRIIKDKIGLLKEKLAKIEQQGSTRRKAREEMIRVSIVGYTNVGKSSLMRHLAKTEDIQGENKLFATVDSTVRKVVLNNVPFLLTDTVGFIRKLPTLLIESFKSTLTEILEADILLHIADISTPYCEEQIGIVNQTLTDLNVEKETILIFNKIDFYEADDVPNMQYLSKNNQKVIYTSAVTKQNLKELKQGIYDLVVEKYYEIYPNYLKPLSAADWGNFENIENNI
ncbi:MAG: GTPase HflX [Bacteroidetes bacterium]|nr:MAG: GTPase HflX [Bacteroidota bacterium]TAG89103.1 MAG: GTPase HflX [Bacteroidota bacterium]